MLKNNRLFAPLLLVVALMAGNRVTQARVAPHIDQCSDVCDINTACNQACFTVCPECLPFNTTCGAASDGACANTCDQVCGPNVDSSTSCEDNGGGSTTCGSYGIYDNCGDDICGENEDSSSCSADCGTEASESDEGILENLVSDMDFVGGFDGTLEGASAGAEVFNAYGYSPGDDVDPIDFENEGQARITCAQKAQRLAAVDKMIKSLKRQLAFFSLCSIGAPLVCGPAAVVVGAALTQAYDLRSEVQEMPCRTVES